MSRTISATWWTLPRWRIDAGSAVGGGHGAVSVGTQTVISSRWTPQAARRRSRDLADRGVRGHGLDDRRQQVRRRRGPRRPSRRSAASQAPGSRSARTRRRPSTWRRSPSGSIRWTSGRAPASSSRNRLTPDDDPVARARSRAGRGRPTPGSGAAGSPPSIAASVPPIASISSRYAVAAASSSSVSDSTNHEPASGSGRLGHARLVGEDLLGAEREPGRCLGRQRERLVARVGVQALGAAEDRGERLERRPDDVVVDRLGGQRSSRRSGCGSGTSSTCGFVAPNRSFMIRAHIRRAARNLATSSNSSDQAAKKNDSRRREVVDREPAPHAPPRRRRSRPRA